MSNVLVTGASRGIGRAIALSLAKRGARVALHFGSDQAAVEETRRAMVGDRHVSLRADLTDVSAIEPLWQAATSALGKVDVLINNAGIFPNHPPLTTDFEDWKAAWQRTLGLDLLAPVHLSYFAARAMAEQGGGRIVNISSRGAFRGEPTAPAYAASKAGLNAFTQSMAKALASSHVHTFVVAPGWVSTERVAESIKNPAVLADQPLGRVATPEEVAQVAIFCALDAPPSMTGSIIDVNGASYLRS
jgi:NAD(P)-dependent dehydrogenase (short-subunit alcohol dehydrogenase family)